MKRLDDMVLFAKVVEAGSFSAAGRELGLQTSLLSRRIAALERALDVRLLNRSTRKLSLTETGRGFYQHCQALAAEAEAAWEAVERTRRAPRGLVRMSCPVELMRVLVAGIVARFIADFPEVRVHIEATNRRVDVIEEGFDLSLRVRSRIDDDSSLVLRRLGEVQELLVASPAYLDRAGRPQQPEELAQHETLSMSEDPNRQQWELHGPDDEVRRIVLGRPRLMGFDFRLLHATARAGQGIALLPELVCADSVRTGELEVVLPTWRLPLGHCHLVYPSRRGVLPAVRALIEFLVERLPSGIEASRLECTRHPVRQDYASGR
jgi:DNA-binding transcriptional LysR family regulator